MTPDQIGMLTALLGLVEKIAGWPLWVVILVVLIGPWIALFNYDRNHERRYLSQKKMYDDNVILLKETQSIARDLKEIVIMNTQSSQQLTDNIEKNQFCPMVRLEKRAGGMQQ